MKRIGLRLLVPALLIAWIAADSAFAARGGGGHRGGGWSGGGGHRGHGHHGHHHGHRHGHHRHGHSHFSFGFVGAFAPWPWYYSGWGYPFYAPRYYYGGAPPYVESAQSYSSLYPLTAAQQMEPAWYYCAPLGAYYPYVTQCPEAWDRVSPTPPPGSDNAGRPE